MQNAKVGLILQTPGRSVVLEVQTDHWDEDRVYRKSRRQALHSWDARAFLGRLLDLRGGPYAGDLQHRLRW